MFNNKKIIVEQLKCHQAECMPMRCAKAASGCETADGQWVGRWRGGRPESAGIGGRGSRSTISVPRERHEEAGEAVVNRNRACGDGFARRCRLARAFYEISSSVLIELLIPRAILCDEPNSARFCQAGAAPEVPERPQYPRTQRSAASAVIS